MQDLSVDRLQKILRMSIIIPILCSLSLFSADHIKIMPLGDSITNGVGSTHFSGYRGPLWTKLSTDAGYNVNFVGDETTGSEYQATDPTFISNHEGHDYFRADQIANEIDIYLGSNPADIILLHIGTNDVKDLISDTDPIIDQTVSEVADILDNIDAYSIDTKVVVAKIINHNLTDDPAKRSATTSYNAKLETMLQTRISNGDDIELVDMETAADINYSSDIDDRLHPNDNGYDKMANLWYDKLKTIIPLHQWKLDETGGTLYVDNFRDANGTCTTGCPTASTGKIDGAQDFNDTAIGGIDVSDVSTFNWDANESFTIELWMKSNEPGATQPDTDENNAVMMGREDTGGNLLWFIGTDKSTGNTIFYADGTITNGTSNIADGTWHHIVCVRDAANSTNSIYVDGVLQSQLSVTNVTLDGGTFPLNIGHLSWDSNTINNSYEYNGMLDEITVYNAVLDDAQIVRHFNDAQPAVLTITSTPVTFAELGTSYAYDVNTSSDNDPSVAFSLLSNLTWMSIDPNSGLISGIPNVTGNLDVEVQAILGAQTDTQNYVLKVRDTASLPIGMEHYWKLDETAGAPYIDAYLGADGTCTTGCPDASTDAQVDSAQLFNDTDLGGIDVSDVSTFNWDANESFTIELWMKSNEPGATQPDTDENNAVMMGREDTGGNLLWFIGTDKSTGNTIFYADGTITNGTSNIADGTWHHIVCVRDAANSTNSIYVDGVFQIESSVTNANLDGGTFPLNIGHLSWNSNTINNSYEYNGMLDEITVFDSALSLTEIQGHFNDGKLGNGFENPTITEVTPVPTPSNNTTPDYTFESSKAGSITYGGTCTSATTAATAGNNTISFNTLADGTYSNCTITVTDASSNASTALEVTTFVIDSTPPVITLTGDDTINVLLNGVYTEQGATCTDNFDTTCTVATGGDSVDTSTVGVYTVRYDTNDTAGNTATQVTRTVNVTAGNAPVINLTGDNPYTVEVHSTYTDPGATATDLEDITVDVSNDSETSINTANLGNQTVTYTATDSHGNTVQTTRTVNVVDSTPPVITITGDDTINVLLNGVYTEQGATCTDNFDTTCTVAIGGDSVDTSTVGVYTVRYDTNDTAGNTATQVTRTVNVVDSTPPSKFYTSINNGDTTTFTSNVGNSTVVFDSALAINVVVTTDKVTFTYLDASGKEAYVEMLNNGKIVTGYRQGTNDIPTSTNGFPAGTKTKIVKDGNDIVIIIETEIESDLIFGGL